MRLTFNHMNLDDETETDQVIKALHNILAAGPKTLELEIPFSYYLLSFRRIIRCSTVSLVTTLRLWITDEAFQKVLCKCLPNFSRLQALTIHGKEMALSLWISRQAVRKLYEYPFGKRMTLTAANSKSRWITVDQHLLEMKVNGGDITWQLIVAITPSKT
uniref:FBA_2 domain-containing protein n=1 Tax=Steinernema glaseri TaxID=37863 RepID=A0A1I8AT77_9BILA